MLTAEDVDIQDARFANALVEGEATKVSACVVSNQETREKVATYLNETPGPDGKAVSVTI